MTLAEIANEAEGAALELMADHGLGALNTEELMALLVEAYQRGHAAGAGLSSLEGVGLPETCLEPACLDYGETGPAGHVHSAAPPPAERVTTMIMDTTISRHYGRVVSFEPIKRPADGYIALEGYQITLDCGHGFVSAPHFYPVIGDARPCDGNEDQPPEGSRCESGWTSGKLCVSDDGRIER